jgi:hypothetical protein
MPDTDLPAVEELSAGCLDTQSTNIDWSEAKGEDMEGWEYWEAFSHTIERAEDDADVDVTLIARESSVVAVFVQGHRIELSNVDDAKIECPICEGEGGECQGCNGEGEVLPGGLHEDEITRLEEVEPYMNGSEGPMMNYYYDLGDSPDSYGRGTIGGWHFQDDEIGTAYKLRDVPLCLVMVNDTFALALTGGGMDLTWSIAEAFCRIGYLPPVKFCRPPGFRTGHQEYLVAAMRRSLTFAQERLANDLEHLNKHGLDR